MNILLSNIRNVITIRLKQTYRLLYQIGIIRLIVLSTLYIVAMRYVYLITGQIHFSGYYISGTWLLIISYIHLKRSDRIFLQINLTYESFVICIEYVLLSIPLIICLLLNRQWILIVCMILGIIFISPIKIIWKSQTKTLNTRMQKYIPFDMYEWKAGVRNCFYPILFCWIIGFCLASFVVGVPIAIFIIGFLIFGFYTTNESLPMLLSYEKGTNSLIIYKIKQHTLIFSILIFPLVGIFMIFHSNLWYIPVIEYVLFLFIHIYSIILKYAFYSHDNSAVNPIFLMMGLFIGLIPLTAPVLWVFSIYLFHKAQVNLSPYLNDYN